MDDENATTPIYCGAHATEAPRPVNPTSPRSTRSPRRLWPALLGLLVLQGAPVVSAGELEEAIAAVERGDYPRAVPALEALATAGDAVAATRLAALYQAGRGVPKDPARAARLYEQAAQRGNADAQFNLGNMYLLGEGVPQDDDWAFTWYREASRQGHRMAQKNVREFYRAAGLTPPPDEVPPPAAAPPAVSVTPPTEPAEDAMTAAAPPPPASPAMTPPATYTADELKAMQIARQHGIRIERADAPAATEAVARVDDPAGPPATPPAGGGDLTEARALLASGKPQAALPLLEAQADSGNAEAQYLLAELLATLRRTPGDELAAVQWLQRAAAGGHADAQFALAARYERGNGVTADDAEAVTWYRAAARQGHAAARERLRAIYREAGLPLPVDVEVPPPAGSGARWPSGHWPLVLIDEAPEYRPCTRHASSLRVA